MDNEDVYVVVIEPSGYMGSLSIVDKSLAESMARQLRCGGRKVRQMDRETYIARLDKEAEEKRGHMKFKKLEKL